jgi:PAS domain S-box-containing protein
MENRTQVRTEQVLMLVLDRGGRIVRMNEACEALTGYRLDEVAGRSVLDVLVPEADRERVGLAIARLLSGEEAVEGTSLLLTRAGERREVSWATTAVPGPDGEPAFLVASGIDTTGRRRADEEIRRAEERYRTLVEQLPLIIYVDRLDELSSNVYTSPQTTRILGYTPEDWLANPRLFVEILHPDDRDRVLAETADVRRSGRDMMTEYRVIARDGRVVWLRDGGTVILDEHGEPALIQGYLLDITEQKLGEEERSRLEEQLQQSAKMEAVGRLAGGIAHDFNNLLTAIQGYSELALGRLETDDPQRRDIEEIRRAAERAASLTRQLLAFGRRQMLQPKVIDLNAVVADMESMLRRLIGEDVELSTDLEPNLGSVRADPGQIEQVLMNLAVNARDAMPGGGCLTISTRNGEVAVGTTRERVVIKPGPYVVLSVADTGHGMSTEVRERIFEPFFTTKEAGRGTGLGLATVYGIVKQSGGYIWVDSAPGAGSAFHIYLPLDGAECDEAEKPHERHEAPAGAETILLVEDEESVRSMIRRVLEEHGYTVLAAGNGEEALELAHEHADEIDLVFTDVVMPGMNGGELVSRLRALRPDIEVVYMSGYAEASVRQGVLETGATYLQKPFTPSALTEVVRRVLEEEAAV